MKDLEATLLSRVHSLERRLRVLSLLLALAFVALALVAATPDPNVKVIDEDLLVVNTLGAKEILMGSPEGPTIRIAADPEPRIQFFSADKKSRVSLGLTKDQAGLMLQSPDGDRTAALLIGPDEGEMVLFRGEERAVRVGTTPFGGLVGIFDAAGNARGGIFMTGNGPVNAVR